jgi:hypothetical protein
VFDVCVENMVHEKEKLISFMETDGNKVPKVAVVRRVKKTAEEEELDEVVMRACLLEKVLILFV